MKKVLFILLVLLFISCNREFKAEKVNVHICCVNESVSELYLVKNYPKDVETRDMLFFGLAKQHMQNLCELDSCISGYIIVFYEDCRCTRGYVSIIEELRGVVSIYERCEDCYLGAVLYERSKENHNVWYLIGSEGERFKDTIYCK